MLTWYPGVPQQHRSRHKAAWIPAYAGMTHPALHSAKMLRNLFIPETWYTKFVIPNARKKR